MTFTVRSLALASGLLLTWTFLATAQDSKLYTGVACSRAVDDYFSREVWPKVASAVCLTCHQQGGDAEKSKLVLKDPRKAQGQHAQDEAIGHNREVFARLARVKYKNSHRLLLKAVGDLSHGGADALALDSTGYRILAEFVRRVNAPPTTAQRPTIDEKNLPPFFDGVVMIDAKRLLRRATLSLAGRLPTPAEKAAIADKGLQAMPNLLDAVMKEDAYFDRLREGFNDIFLTVGLNDIAETAILSYEHFEKSRLWYQNHDLSHLPEKDRQKARYKLVDDYRQALLGEPMKLIEHIVRNDRPFTEIVTADYIMVTPYSARGYGIFDAVKDRFKNPDDPFEYIPVRLKALKGRSKANTQESATGFCPHAGLLASFPYLARYPTTETNRNRLRTRMYYQHFLGVDLLELAARVADAAAVTAKFPNPTMQAPECVVCHRTMDPVAGCFQDYWRFDANFALYGKRKGGWFDDMFTAGFEGENLPSEQRWRALQWLGERTAKDPRFAVAMVEHVWYILSGRKVLTAPKDLDDPLYTGKRRAYQEQRRQIEKIAERFRQSGFNLKSVFKDWILSDFYRADGLATTVSDPRRRAELDDLGVYRMLAPEQVERKLAAIFGQRWGRLREQLAILYGGIDSEEVTERASDPSGAMGAIQRMLANEVATRHTLRDFALAPAERRLFPGIEPDVLPGSSSEADATIRRAIVHLHELILGREDAPDSAEVTRTFELFAGIVADAKGRKGIEKVEIYHARSRVPNAPADPHYTIRAWRAVVTYLLRRPEFLYE